MHDAALLSRVPSGQFRLRRLVAELEPAVKTGGADAIRRIDYSARPNGEMFAILSADGRLELHAAHRRENLLTGEVIVETTASRLPWRQPEKQGPPDFLLLSDQGDHVFAAWQDGTLLDFDTRDFDHPKLGRTARPGARSRASGSRPCGFCWARRRCWPAIRWAGCKPGSASTPSQRGIDEPARLVKAHTFAGPTGRKPAEVRCLAPSGNSRLFGVGYADRRVRLYYPTNERLVLDTQAPTGRGPRAVDTGPERQRAVGPGRRRAGPLDDRPRLSRGQLALAVLAGLVRRHRRGRRWSGSRDRVRPARSRS